MAEWGFRVESRARWAFWRISRQVPVSQRNIKNRCVAQTEQMQDFQKHTHQLSLYIILDKRIKL